MDIVLRCIFYFYIWFYLRICVHAVRLSLYFIKGYLTWLDHMFRFRNRVRNRVRNKVRVRIRRNGAEPFAVCVHGRHGSLPNRQLPLSHSRKQCLDFRSSKVVRLESGPVRITGWAETEAFQVMDSAPRTSNTNVTRSICTARRMTNSYFQQES